MLDVMAASPGKLTDRALEEFRAIYKEEFGEELSLEEAREMALRVLHVVALLLQSP